MESGPSTWRPQTPEMSLSHFDQWSGLGETRSQIPLGSLLAGSPKLPSETFDWADTLDWEEMYAAPPTSDIIFAPGAKITEDSPIAFEERDYLYPYNLKLAQSA